MKYAAPLTLPVNRPQRIIRYLFDVNRIAAEARDVAYSEYRRELRALLGDLAAQWGEHKIRYNDYTAQCDAFAQRAPHIDMAALVALDVRYWQTIHIITTRALALISAAENIE